jgi:hypothetical protein
MRALEARAVVDPAIVGLDVGLQVGAERLVQVGRGGRDSRYTPPR